MSFEESCAPLYNDAYPFGAISETVGLGARKSLLLGRTAITVYAPLAFLIDEKKTLRAQKTPVEMQIALQENWPRQSASESRGK